MDLKGRPVLDLLRLNGDILNELRRRKILTTLNAPLGDYAESLFRQAFGWSAAENSTKGFDAVDASGLRYQIKARRLHTKNKSRQLGAIRRLDEENFHVLGAVLFKDDYTVLRAALIPHAVVFQHATYVEATNSWKFILRDSVWDAPKVKDCTAELLKAQAEL